MTGKALAINDRVLGDENQTMTTGAEPKLKVVGLPADPTLEQTLRLVEASGSLDFWHDPDEDIYSIDDGEPV